MKKILLATLLLASSYTAQSEENSSLEDIVSVCNTMEALAESIIYSIYNNKSMSEVLQKYVTNIGSESWGKINLNLIKDINAKWAFFEVYNITNENYSLDWDYVSKYTSNLNNECILEFYE